MLSYRHGFHAGNPADVFKHAVLIALVRAMQVKDKGIRFIDTHAGAALYDLTSEFAIKNREFDRGVASVWTTERPADALADYREAVQRYNPDGRLRWYPGSPRLLHDLQRRQDELVLCERHPTEQRVLERQLGHATRVTVHAGDGYAALPRWLPPPTGRALTLIDPPWELKSEFDDLQTALIAARKRCPHAVYMIWYPLLEGKDTTLDPLPRALDLHGEAWLDLRIRFGVEQRMGRMHGCGLGIINCPFRARQPVAELCKQLDAGPLRDANAGDT